MPLLRRITQRIRFPFPVGRTSSDGAVAEAEEVVTGADIPNTADGGNTVNDHIKELKARMAHVSTGDGAATQYATGVSYAIGQEVYWDDNDGVRHYYRRIVAGQDNQGSNPSLLPNIWHEVVNDLASLPVDGDITAGNALIEMLAHRSGVRGNRALFDKLQGAQSEAEVRSLANTLITAAIADFRSHAQITAQIVAALAPYATTHAMNTAINTALHGFATSVNVDAKDEALRTRILNDLLGEKMGGRGTLAEVNGGRTGWLVAPANGAWNGVTSAITKESAGSGMEWLKLDAHAFIIGGHDKGVLVRVDHGQAFGVSTVPILWSQFRSISGDFITGAGRGQSQGLFVGYDDSSDDHPIYAECRHSGGDFLLRFAASWANANRGTLWVEGMG